MSSRRHRDGRGATDLKRDGPHIQLSGVKKQLVALRQLPDDAGVRARRKGGGRSDGRGGVHPRTGEEMMPKLRARKRTGFLIYRLYTDIERSRRTALSRQGKPFPHSGAVNHDAQDHRGLRSGGCGRGLASRGLRAEGHGHGKKAKKVKKSKAKQAADRIRRPASGGLMRPLQLRVFSRARRKGCNCLGQLNHSLSFPSHYCDRPASGRRVAPVHSV